MDNNMDFDQNDLSQMFQYNDMRLSQLQGDNDFDLLSTASSTDNRLNRPCLIPAPVANATWGDISFNEPTSDAHDEDWAEVEALHREDLGGEVAFDPPRETGVQDCSPGFRSMRPRAIMAVPSGPRLPVEDMMVFDPRSAHQSAMRDRVTAQSSPKALRDPRGAFNSLPVELMAMINHHLCDDYWQCFQRQDQELQLLGSSHSSPVPALLRTSATLRNDFLYTAASSYATRPATITIGTDIIAFNFPLATGLVPWNALEDSLVRLPQTCELFIGIQVPSPRVLDNMIAARDNVKRVVALLNNIGNRSPLPPIRVSFETNARTRSLHYQSNDWYTLIAPLSELRLSSKAPGTSTRKPLVIDRCQRFNCIEPERHLISTIVEDIVGHIDNDHGIAFCYTQSMMDVKLCLVVYNRSTKSDESLLERLEQTTRVLVGWYNTHSVAGPLWLQRLYSAFTQPHSIDQIIEVGEVSKHVAKDYHKIRDWVNGHQRSSCPFWKTGQTAYWC